MMSAREKAVRLLNLIDEDRMIFIVRILESLVELAEIPNEITVAAIKEGDEMLENGTGERYASVDELFADLEE